MKETGSKHAREDKIHNLGTLESGKFKYLTHTLIIIQYRTRHRSHSDHLKTLVCLPNCHGTT